MTKSLLTAGILLCLVLQLSAQAPQAINFQGLARDAQGTPVEEANISLRFTIIDQTIGGPAVYSEEHVVKTNEVGLFTVFIGKGTPSAGNFGDINWSNSPKFLKVEMDPAGGASYQLMGISQFASVPYALFAEKTGNILKAGSGIVITGDSVRALDNDPLNEIQVLSRNGNDILLSKGGGSVSLPEVSDSDSTNEIQFLSITGNQLTLSNNGGVVLLPDQLQTLSIQSDSITLSKGGGTVALPKIIDNDTTNELQALSIAGSNISLSRGGGVISLPPDPDPDSTNEIQSLSLSGNQISLSRNGGSIAIDHIQTLSLSLDTLKLSKNGGAVVLPRSLDNDTTNELQALSLSSGQITLSKNGGSVTLPDHIQTLSLSGDSLTLSKGGGVVSLPKSLDNDTTNEIQSLSLSGNNLSLSKNGSSVTLPVYWRAVNSSSSTLKDLQTDSNVVIGKNAIQTGKLTVFADSANPEGGLFFSNISSTRPVLLVWNFSDTKNDRPAFVSSSSFHNYYGIGAEADGGYRGLRAKSTYIAVHGFTEPSSPWRFTSSTHALGGLFESTNSGVALSYGCVGKADSGTSFNIGIKGEAGFAPNSFGVSGTASSSKSSSSNVGVDGVATTSGAAKNFGVSGTAGSASSQNVGVFGQASGTNSHAGAFIGQVTVVGTLSKSAGSFKIDHPQDPENKFLVHSFVESPDMMNIYNGNITTDSTGTAVVILPSYFQAENIDYRYQLTVIGVFAQAIIYQKIEDNKFVIKTDKPLVEVSWQVTGVRNDPYAQTFRIRPEVEKTPEERGKYLHPELYGAGLEKSIISPAPLIQKRITF